MGNNKLKDNNMFSGIASAGLNAIVGGLSQIGAKKRQIESEQRQLAMQKELNEQTAALNYEYGEKSAENADARSRALYEDYSSPQAMVQQYKDAGLNVGLMYGGSGGTGGSGTLSAGKQGSGASGISPGAAPNTAQSKMAEIEKQKMLQQMSLQTLNLESQIEVNKSVAEKNKAEAEESRSNAGLSEEKMITEKETRPILIENMKQEGIEKFVSNMDKAIERGTPIGWFSKITEEIGGEYTEDGYKANDIVIDVQYFKNNVYGFTYAMSQNSYYANMMLQSYQEILQNNIEKGNIIEIQGIQIDQEKLKVWQQAASILLTDAQIKKTFVDMSVAIQNADSNRINALANQLSAQVQEKQYELKEKIANWETYNFTRWKSEVKEFSMVILSAIAGMAGTIITKGKGGTKTTTIEGSKGGRSYYETRRESYE